MRGFRTRFRQSPAVLFAAAAFVFGGLSGAWASRLRQVNLDEMTRRAAVIFAGRCLEVEVAFDPAIGHEVTRVLFEVERAVKGTVGRSHTIRMAGANGADAWAVAGLPRFAPGEDLVVFLYGASTLGFSSPVGFGQGTFRVIHDKQGRRVAVNDYGNAYLLQGLSGEAASRVRTVTTNWQEGSPIDPKTLLDVTEALGRAAP